MALGEVDRGFWRDRRVLLTGHTGFKGGWLALWLQSMGARVSGFSAGVPTRPSLYELARVNEDMESITGDVRDSDAVRAVLAAALPDVVFHMAAQPLVRRSFAEPRKTFQTNVMGTVNVLDAVRLSENVRVVVNVTSDKCYENKQTERAYTEDDPIGGSDPYSSSKAAAELVSAAFRHSFFSDPTGTRLASARAGNAIGGGDWSEDRLVPDVMRAAIQGTTLRVREADAVRPWQHVLNPLSGYLVLAQALWGSQELAGAWNFGPAEQDVHTVGWVVERMAELWPGGLRWTHEEGSRPPEARYLRLDSTRARSKLGWKAPVSLDLAIAATVAWYRALHAKADMRTVTLEQVERLSQPHRAAIARSTSASTT
jgi:CDP-glucose 4,6-dehydratase